jgi:hypothetical protein
MFGVHTFLVFTSAYCIFENKTFLQPKNRSGLEWPKGSVC